MAETTVTQTIDVTAKNGVAVRYIAAKDAPSYDVTVDPTTMAEVTYQGVIWRLPAGVLLQAAEMIATDEKESCICPDHGVTPNAGMLYSTKCAICAGKAPTAKSEDDNGFPF